MSFTEQVAKRVLPNGLTLLVERHAASPVVAVVTHVRAGYFDEPDEWVGISHVLEHMFFKGTARRKPGDVARETQRVGGYINAGTIYDKTVYYTVLPSSERGLERSLDVQADALRNAAIDAGELARELEVIVQEAKRKLDSPPAVASESLYALLFRAHRMRRWRIGTEETLRRLTRDDVRRYYETRYTPDRVIVGLVGDLDVGHALDLAERAYGEWDRAPADVPGSPPEPPGTAPSFRAIHGDLERPLARIGWKTVGALHPDAPALDVAGDVLGSGRGSRLYRALRAPGLADAAGAGHYAPPEVGVFELGLRGDGTRLDDAMARSLALVQRLVDDGPSKEELRRVHALLAVHWAHRFEAVNGRATAFCDAEALGDYGLVDELYQRTLAVDVDDVRRVARTYLDPESASAVCFLASGAGTRFAGAWPPVPPGDVAPLPPIATRPARARANGGPDRVADHAGGVRRWSAAGADVLVQSKRGTGLVTVGLHFAGPPSCETEDTAGISWLSARTALRGAGGLTGEALAQAAEVLGGSCTASVGTESLGWWLTVRAEHLAEAAGLLEAVAGDAAMAVDDVVLERAQQAGDARSARDDMLRHPIQRVLAHAFPGHAYGLPALGTPESVAALAPELVREWADGLAARRAIVVAVGDLPADELFHGVARLAAWLGAESEAASPTPRWTAARGAEQRKKAQSALALAFPAAPFAAPERYPITVLSALLSGLAGRLFDELRERRSLAYTVAAAPWLARQAGAFVTYIATSPERETEARDAMLDELARLTREPPSADELDRARTQTAGGTDLKRQRGANVAGEVLDGWLYGHLDELPETADRLRRVTADELVAVAERMFDPDTRAEYVVRGG